MANLSQLKTLYTWFEEKSNQFPVLLRASESALSESVYLGAENIQSHSTEYWSILPSGKLKKLGMEKNPFKKFASEENELIDSEFSDYNETIHKYDSDENFEDWVDSYDRFAMANDMENSRKAVLEQLNNKIQEINKKTKKMSPLELERKKISTQEGVEYMANVKQIETLIKWFDEKSQDPTVGLFAAEGLNSKDIYLAELYYSAYENSKNQIATSYDVETKLIDINGDIKEFAQGPKWRDSDEIYDAPTQFIAETYTLQAEDNAIKAFKLENEKDPIARFKLFDEMAEDHTPIATQRSEAKWNLNRLHIEAALDKEPERSR